MTTENVKNVDTPMSTGLKSPEVKHVGRPKSVSNDLEGRIRTLEDQLRVSQQTSEAILALLKDKTDFKSDLSPEEAAGEVLKKRHENSKERLRKRKENTVPVRYEIRPYVNRPQKQDQMKLILVQKNSVSGNTFRNLIGRNVPFSNAQKLLQLTGNEIVAEHTKRKNRPNYGYVIRKAA